MYEEINSKADQISLVPKVILKNHRSLYNTYKFIFVYLFSFNLSKIEYYSDTFLHYLFYALQYLQLFNMKNN